VIPGVSRTKASSHPTRPDGIYLGVVKRVLPDGKVYVYVPKLANTIGPMQVVNTISGFQISEGNRVLCGNVGGGTEEMYVIGHLSQQVSSEVVQVFEESRDIKIIMFMDVG
jgi:hypothetical protein